MLVQLKEEGGGVKSEIYSVHSNVHIGGEPFLSKRDRERGGGESEFLSLCI